MSAQSARAYFSISEVLAQLRGEYPDVSVSKIRFLESEGLIEPARSPSGYRRFGAADVERLRYILSAQRDQYLPLRVIKKKLAAIDRGEERGPRAALGLVVPLSQHDAGAQRSPLTRRDLAEAAGIGDDQLAELEDFGLIRRTGRWRSRRNCACGSPAPTPPR